MKVESLDHLVLTVADVDATARWYARCLGMVPEPFTVADGSTRMALTFGRQKINLHPAPHGYDPKADRPTPGSADLCFLVEGSLTDWAIRFAQAEVEVIEGPVRRTGATGPIESLYVRDPDGNLIEVSVPR